MNKIIEIDYSLSFSVMDHFFTSYFYAVMENINKSVVC